MTKAEKDLAFSPDDKRLIRWSKRAKEALKPYFANPESKLAEIFVAGYMTAESNLGWHSVEESLPPMDEEVIVLSGLGKISFGHIVNKDYAQDYNGWNIPGVTHWMPCPKIEEEE